MGKNTRDPSIAGMYIHLTDIPTLVQVEWLDKQEDGDNNEACHASIAYDMWSLGVLLYTMCVPGAVGMFLSSANDEILSQDDLYTLAFQWEVRKHQRFCIRNEGFCIKNEGLCI